MRCGELQIGVETQRCLLAVLVAVFFTTATRAAEAELPDLTEVEFFEKKIRPVLVKRCLGCHSDAKGKTGGGLALDTRDGWKKGGDSGSPIVTGKPEKSLLIEAVRYNDIGLQMPPEDKGGKLPAGEIALLVEWIKRGAPDPRIAASRIGGMSKEESSRWWSLQPVRAVQPPKSEQSKWPKHDLDRFILAKLNKHKLQPAQDADALTLLRRLSFVLTGLPPDPKTVQTFPTQYADNADSALAAVVDDLLDSPHYGERIARHWMDVVRYTDTYGYEWDNPAKGSWEYRDYLIRAFNRDIGFDQLVREQIAGDLLQPARIDETSGFNESLIGPMFYHMGEHRHGDNVVINGVREEMVDNKIDAFSKSFLAMTIACARCHDHKLDPVLQRDYYALAGVFMTPRWTSRSIDAPQKNAGKIAELQRLRDEIQARLADVWTVKDGPLASGETLQAWAAANQSSLAAAKQGDIGWPISNLLAKTTWREPKQLIAKADNDSTKLIVEKDNSILAGGEIPATDSYSVTFQTGPGTINQLRLEALTHDSLGSRGPGRTPHGNFVLSHLRVSVRPYTASKDKVGSTQDVDIAAARADYSQPNYPVADALQPTASKGWGVGLGGNVDRTAWFTFAKPVKLPHGGEWTVTLAHQYGTQHILGRFRITPGVNLPDAAESRVANDTEAITTWKRLETEWRSTHEARKKQNADRFELLSDFSKPELPAGWIADGDGMRTGYVSGGQPLIALEGEGVVAQLLPQGYHTHALSPKLPGALRLPSQQALPGKFASVALAGGEWSGYLRVADNGFQTEDVKFLDRREPAWQALADIAPSNGIQRIAYEIATSDLNPNFPPRTGVARAGGKTLPSQDEGFGKRSWFSVTGIVTHDAGGQPADELREFASLYAGMPPIDAATTWTRLRNWLGNSIDNWKYGHADNGDVALINWMLQQGLLTNGVKQDEKLAAMVERYRQVESSVSFPRTANSMDEREVTPIDYAMNIRGDINVRGEAVPRDFLSVLSSKHKVGESSGSGRLRLANFLTDPKHGMTARVYVNRVWQWVFGTGLVRTPNDFGALGDSPSHPELLDYLTRQFIADGWSTKRLIRRLVLSRAFRQAGTAGSAGLRVDPDNRWLHHYPTRRLEAEAIRDALLAVSGRFEPKLYGRPINPRRHVEDPAKRLFSGPLDGNGRRSIYLEVSIMDRSKFLQSFNAPDPKLPTGRRDVTNVPAQALVMLNDPFVLAMADQWAEKLLQDRSTSVEMRLQSMFLKALGRPLRSDESARWVDMVKSLGSGKGDLLADRAAWKHTAHTLFNTQEFIHYK